MAALTDGFVPQPTHASPSPTSYSTPANADLAAVVTTVALVGILMAVLITWLFFRLRHTTSSTEHAFRPSFAPSETSSKFTFIRKPLRLSRRNGNTSWDFADPDPLPHQKETSLEPPSRSPSQKRRPPPLAPAPAYTPRAQRTSTYKDEFGPHTPTTPAELIEPPPPAYCRESNPCLVYQSKALSPN